MLLAFAVAPLHAKEDLGTVKQRMIRESLSKYHGNCPCPYNYASNGSHCGARSAYNRAGGISPLCYPTDISDEEALQWQKTHKLD
jgi:hypothetical protein